MKAVLLTRNASHQQSWCGAFGKGLQKHGWSVVNATSYQPCDMLVHWGARRRAEDANQKKRGGEVCILERGYIGDRFKWTSVSFGGGLNGRGVFRGPFADGSRFAKHFELQPWQETLGGYALVMGQVPGDAAVVGVDLARFYRKAQAAFAALGMKTKLRQHPMVFGRSAKPIADDLANARCAVTWNSNSGVDAVLAGVPAVAMDQGSMAWDVTAHELTLPPKPERQAWANALAWKQWTMDELESGYCWENIKP